uniref:Uncharacterized protein n=1 Tax=Aegilops tauschii subsp. strangulata TaxID=200361 RepID=A0A452Y491_AEGTS
LRGKDGREVVGLAAEDPRLGVREELHPGQLRHRAVAGDADRVGEEVAGEVALWAVGRVEVPVPFGHGVHLVHALEALRPLERLVHHAEVLVPQRHPEPVHLPPRRPARRQVARLVPAHGDLRVARPVHGPLVDVRRPHDDVLVVHDHHLGVDVDHEPAVLLRLEVVAVGLGLLWRLVLAGLLGLPVAEAEEGEVVLGFGVDPLGLDGLRDVAVHHLHGPPLPVQDGLHGPARWDALRPHGHHHVHGEPLPGLDLAHHLHGQLLGEEVQRADVVGVDAVALPAVGAPQEVLVLDVDEALGPPDGADVRVLDAPVDDLVLAAHQARLRRVLGVVREPEGGAAVDGPEQLHVPRLPVLGVHHRRRRDDVVGEVPELDEQVLAALLAPPLLEVVEHVPRHGALEAAVDVVPRLPRPALGDRRRREVGLVEVVVVGAVQRPEQGVERRVVATVAEVKPAHEAEDPPAPAAAALGHVVVHDDGLLVVREHGGDLQVLDEAAGVVGVPGAEHAVHVGVLEVVHRLLVVRRHEAVLLEHPNRGPVVPDQHEDPDALAGLLLEQLAERDAAAGRLGPVGVPEQRDLRVHGPSRDVDEVLGIADGGEDVLPAAVRLVAAAVVERDPGDEAVGDVGVLVQRHLAPLALGEEGVGHAGVLPGADAAAPGPVLGDVEVLELDVDLAAALDGVAAVVAEREPALDLVAAVDVADGEVARAHDGGADGAAALDGEEHVGGEVRAVDVEGLEPARGRRLVVQRASAADAGLAKADGGVELARAFADAHRVLDPLHQLLLTIFYKSTERSRFFS